MTYIPYDPDYAEWIALQAARAALEAVAEHDDEAFLDALEAATAKVLAKDGEQ